MQELESLEKKIELLEGDQAEQVLEFLKEHGGLIVGADDPDELQLDLQALDPLRQRQLLEMVDLSLRLLRAREDIAEVEERREKEADTTEGGTTSASAPEKKLGKLDEIRQSVAQQRGRSDYDSFVLPSHKGRILGAETKGQRERQDLSSEQQRSHDSTGTASRLRNKQDRRTIESDTPVSGASRESSQSGKRGGEGIGHRRTLGMVDSMYGDLDWGGVGEKSETLHPLGQDHGRRESLQPGVASIPPSRASSTANPPVTQRLGDFPDPKDEMGKKEMDTEVKDDPVAKRVTRGEETEVEEEEKAEEGQENGRSMESQEDEEAFLESRLPELNDDELAELVVSGMFDVDEFEWLREVFASADADHSGDLNVLEVKSGAETFLNYEADIEMSLSVEAIPAQVKKYAQVGHTVLRFPEFLRLVYALKVTPDLIPMKPLDHQQAPEHKVETVNEGVDVEEVKAVNAGLEGVAVASEDEGIGHEDSVEEEDDAGLPVTVEDITGKAENEEVEKQETRQSKKLHRTSVHNEAAVHKEGANEVPKLMAPRSSLDHHAPPDTSKTVNILREEISQLQDLLQVTVTEKEKRGDECKTEQEARAKAEDEFVRCLKELQRLQQEMGRVDEECQLTMKDLRNAREANRELTEETLRLREEVQEHKSGRDSQFVHMHEEHEKMEAVLKETEELAEEESKRHREEVSSFKEEGMRWLQELTTSRNEEIRLKEQLGRARRGSLEVSQTAAEMQAESRKLREELHDLRKERYETEEARLEMVQTVNAARRDSMTDKEKSAAMMVEVLEEARQAKDASEELAVAQDALRKQELELAGEREGLREKERVLEEAKQLLGNERERRAVDLAEARHGMRKEEEEVAALLAERVRMDEETARLRVERHLADETGIKLRIEHDEMLRAERSKLKYQFDAARQRHASLFLVLKDGL